MRILSYFFLPTPVFVVALLCCGKTAGATESAAAKAATEPLFKFAEWKTALQATLPLPLENESSASTAEADVAAQTGLKLIFAAADLRCYLTRPSLDSDCTEPRFGGAVFFAQKTHPVTLKAGRLSFGYSLSRLKNPSPATTLTPLARTYSVHTGLHASLPILSSSVQPLSVSVACSSGSKSVCVEAAAQKDSTSFVSAHGASRINRAVRAEWAVTGARFCLESTSTLKSAGSGFDSCWKYAALTEVAVFSPLVSILLQGGAHQTPYTNSALWLYGKTRMTWQSLQLTATAFCIPTADDAPQAAPLIGGSSSVCHIRKQLGLQPQLLFLLTDTVALRCGAHLLWQERITATKYADLFTTNKAALACAVESSSLTSELTLSGVNLYTTGDFHTASSIPDTCYEACSQLTAVRPKLKTTVKLDAKHYPAQALKSTPTVKDVLTAACSASPGARRLLTATASLTATWKDKVRTAGSATCKVTVRKPGGTFRLQASCALVMPF